MGACKLLRIFGKPQGSLCKWLQLSASLHPFRKFRMRMTSLLWLPFVSSNCRPSRDQAKSKIRPRGNWRSGGLLAGQRLLPDVGRSRTV